MTQYGISIYWGGTKPEKPLPHGFEYSALSYNKPTTVYNSEGKRFLLRRNPDALIPQVDGYVDRWDFNNPILL